VRDQLGAPYADAQSVMMLIYDYSGSGDFVGGVCILTVLRSCFLLLGMALGRVGLFNEIHITQRGDV
jgi:hypothetical protein